MQMDILRIFSEVYYLLILYIILHNKFYGFDVLLFAYDLYVFITISLVSFSIKWIENINLCDYTYLHIVVDDIKMPILLQITEW